MAKRRLTDGPWVWRKLGGACHLIADWGSRRVILTDANTCGADGTLEPVTPDSPDMRLIAESPNLYDLLTKIADSGALKDADLQCEVINALGRIR